MQRLQDWGALGLVVFCMNWIAISVAFAAGPADGVPDSASVVIRWKAPQTSVENLARYIDTVQVGYEALVKAGLPEAGESISIPQFKGVDLTQDIWVVVFAESGGPPAVVVMLTAKDADDIKDALGDDFTTHVADKLVIYSQDDDSVEAVRDQLKKKDSSLWSKIDAASKKLFDGSDLSALVNLQQLTEEFADELVQAEPQIDVLLDQIENAVPEAQRDQIGPIFDVYRQLAKSILQGVRDSNSLTLGISFTETAIRYESRLQIEDDTDLAGYVAKQSTSALPLLNRLPTNRPIYFGFKGDMAGLINWSLKVNQGLMKSATPETTEKLNVALKEMSTLKFEDMAGYMDIATTAPAIRFGSVSQVKPTRRLREMTLDMIKSMGKIEVPGLVQTTTIEPGYDKLGGSEIDRIVIKQEIDDDNDPTGIQAKIRKIVMGEDGMEQLAIYQADRVVQVMGGGKAELQSLVTAIDGTPASSSPVVTARKRLADKANLLVLADVAHLIANTVKVAAAEGELKIDSDTLDSIKVEPSFIGFALACEPTAIRSQVDIPVAQVQSIVKVILPLVPFIQAQVQQ